MTIDIGQNLMYAILGVAAAVAIVLYIWFLFR